MRIRIIVAVGLVAVGLVWLGQGLGLLRGSSFMVGDPAWAVFGTALAAAGLVIGLSARRRPRA